MINHNYKFILILLPKTGSTSLSDFAGVKVDNKATKHYDDLGDTEMNYLKFSTCRNPYSRIVSVWKYWESRFKTKNITFHSFDHFIKNLDDMKNLVTTKCGNKRDLIHFMGCTDGVMYATSKKISHNDIDFWIKTESLQKDINIVCDKLGISHQKLPYKNASNHRHYTEYYDDETKSIVAEKYAKDIEYFGYEFGE